MKTMKSWAIAICCIAAAFTATAQRNAIIKEIAEMDGISYVYTPTKSKSQSHLVPEYQVPSELDAGSSKATHVIDVEKPELIKKVTELLKGITQNSKYQLLMRSKDEDGSTVESYGLYDTDGKSMKEQILICKEDDELNIIYNEW